MLKPTLRPPPSLQPRFAASITPGAAAGHDREAGLGEQPRRLPRLPVRIGLLADPRRAEDRHGRPVDLEHLLEAAEELGRDHGDVVRQLLVRALEDAPVVGSGHPR